MKQNKFYIKLDKYLIVFFDLQGHLKKVKWVSSFLPSTVWRNLNILVGIKLSKVALTEPRIKVFKLIKLLHQSCNWSKGIGDLNDKTLFRVRSHKQSYPANSTNANNVYKHYINFASRWYNVLYQREAK